MNKKTFLVVEDGHCDQFFANLVLSDYYRGCDILEAYDGNEALEILNKKRYPIDLIFLDLNTPEMNGFEFLDQYNTQFENTGGPPVCILTTSNNQDDLTEAVSYGCVFGYILKPLGRENLSSLSFIIDGENSEEGLITAE